MATLNPKKKEERRAVSHNPQTLPDRTANTTAPNAPWIPPQQHARAASAQIPRHKLLSPLAPPAEVHRRPLGSESSTSLRASSATSSPVGSRPPTGYSSQPASPYRTLPPHHTLPVPGQSPGGLSPTGDSPTDSPTSKGKRKSWLPGGGARLTKPGKDIPQEKPPAWVVGLEATKPAYDLAPLLNAQQVPELWNPQGNTFIYLFPRTSGHGPSFRIDSSIFSSSTVLTDLAFGRLYSVPGAGMSTASLAQASQAHARQMSMDHGGIPGSRGVSPSAPVIRSSSNSVTDPSEDSMDSRGLEETNSGPIHLCLPISLSADSSVTATGGAPHLTDNDVDTLVAVRNLFAFLLGQSIVATARKPSIFLIFLKVSDFLNSFGFSNLDGSTYGEVAHASFTSYVDELKISDVRASREKTIEAIILGEKMRSVLLYNEAFVHGVGKWDELIDMQNPKFDMISRVTKVRMERAHLELEARTRNIKRKLIDFDFPAMFSGIMNSKTAVEAKAVRFSVWRESFMAMRRFFVGYYKHKYGAWPPKASSKKNTLEISGLNRVVLKALYQDLSDLYDLLVNRTSLTSRTTDMVLEDDDSEDAEGPMHRALRKVLNEYDRSTPPVQPPMPFDIPIIPSITLTGDPKTDTKNRGKKMKKEQLYQVLREAYNTPEKDANGQEIPTNPFIAAFIEFEYSQASHTTIGHIADLRQGQWLFLYAVLQSLPMLIIDAPALQWTHGVEYFLCMPPRSGVPWCHRGETDRTYYAVAGSNSAVVSLPSDVIEFGVEGIYRRSHCWTMAEKWAAHSSLMTAIVEETTMSQLPPLPPFGEGAGAESLVPRSSSPQMMSREDQRRSIMMSGLEALPMPPGVYADLMNPGVRRQSPGGSPVLGPRGSPRGSPRMRPVSMADTSKTFDSILGAVEAAKPVKAGKKIKK